MFYEEQVSSNGTVSHRKRLGPARSSSERFSCAVDVSVSVGLVDRSVLDLTLESALAINLKF
jgi:hypothetical protein